MASMKFSLVLLLGCVLSLPGVLADIICEKLPANVCAFAVSSSGKRCVLENSILEVKVEYQCKTSEVVVGSSTVEYLESDECLNACGVHWKTVGMSSDSLLEPGFTAKLCSHACYNSCPNIVDLYFNLAAGEGVYLPYLCDKYRTPRRAMVELLSSDAAAAAPAADVPTQRRAMMEFLSSGAAAPAPAADDDVPIQRRAMVELLSSGAATPNEDDFVVDTPAPSPLYF